MLDLRGYTLIFRVKMVGSNMSGQIAGQLPGQMSGQIMSGQHLDRKLFVGKYLIIHRAHQLHCTFDFTHTNLSSIELNLDDARCHSSVNIQYFWCYKRDIFIIISLSQSIGGLICTRFAIILGEKILFEVKHTVQTGMVSTRSAPFLLCEFFWFWSN